MIILFVCGLMTELKVSWKSKQGFWEKPFATRLALYIWKLHHYMSFIDTFNWREYKEKFWDANQDLGSCLRPWITFQSLQTRILPLESHYSKLGGWVMIISSMWSSWRIPLFMLISRRGQLYERARVRIILTVNGLMIGLKASWMAKPSFWENLFATRQALYLET